MHASVPEFTILIFSTKGILEHINFARDVSIKEGAPNDVEKLLARFKARITGGKECPNIMGPQDPM
jgi:hypothetical protein